MNEFNGNSRRIESAGFDSEALARCIYQKGPDAFAAVQHGIAHGFVQALRRPLDRRQCAVQARSDPFRVVRNPVFERYGQ